MKPGVEEGLFLFVVALGLLSTEGPKGPAGSTCLSTTPNSSLLSPLLAMLVTLNFL